MSDSAASSGLMAELRATVEAMRQRLEAQRLEMEEFGQAVEQRCAAEIQDLKSTARALREALEQSRQDAAVAAEKATAAATAELSELRAMARGPADAA